jgi:hypothetical protein
MSFMHWLRGRNRRIGGALLPMLAAVWLSASASPCFGMAAAGKSASDERAVVANPHAAHVDHSHAPPQPAPGGGHDHGNCPHCPPSPMSAATSAEHFGCATLADGAPISKAPQPELKAGLHFPGPDFLSASTPRPRPPPRSLDRQQPHVPLNLRHCVFVI